jgi:hypothetical protein
MGGLIALPFDNGNRLLSFNGDKDLRKPPCLMVKIKPNWHDCVNYKLINAKNKLR